MTSACARRGRCIYLATPPVPLVAAEAAQVFDAHAWCASRDLEWRCPEGHWDPSTPIDGSNPARMVFVVRREASERAAFLPRELARLHAFGLGLTDEEALAPWAIDDATDELYARRLEPRDALLARGRQPQRALLGPARLGALPQPRPLRADAARVDRAPVRRDRPRLALDATERLGVRSGRVGAARRQVEALCRARFVAERRALRPLRPRGAAASRDRRRERGGRKPRRGEGGRAAQRRRRATGRR